MDTDGVTEFDGAQLAWTAGGEGPTVVLLHAGVADQRMWPPLLELLPGRRTVRLDLRGFGASRSRPGGYSPVKDTIAVLDDAGVERATVVGASFGGMIALELAATAPERVGALVLLAPALPEFDWSDEVQAFGKAEEEALTDGDLDAAVELNLRMWVDRGEHVTPAIRELVADMQRLAFELQEDLEPDGLDPPVNARLQAIVQPTTVMVGDRDVGDFQRIAAHLAAELPDAELRTVAGAAHLLALERPEEAAEAVLSRSAPSA